MMKHLTFFIVSILFFTCSSSVSPSDKQDAAQEKNSENISDGLRNAIDDCQKLMEQPLRRTPVISTTQPNADIFLTKTTPSNFSQTFEKQLLASREAFHILSKKGKIQIYAKTDDALSHGLYFLLEKLGFRFYLPHETWTITPKSLNFNDLNLDEVVSPKLKVREFFGSGGFAVNRQIDPNNKRREAWEVWKMRNRMGGNRKIWGHQGYDFNQQNRAELEKHPEYLAEIGGKRIAWAKKAKWCISNEGFVQLFIEDRLKEHQNNVIRFGKDSPEAQSIGVEPTDGGGHCTCQNCEKMGSISTRVFHLANRVAAVFEKKHPGVWVSVLAYNQHGDTPDLDILPNVDVCIIPSGFHDVAPGPAYIQKWQNKLRRPMGLYDYWAIPLWGLDLPRFGIYNVANRLVFWQKNGVDAVLLESSYSQGSIGLPLYLMARTGWEENMSCEAILEEFYQNCFPNARKPMERMFRRWSHHFLELDEIPFALRDIIEALNLAKTDTEKQRVEHWAAYVHYIKLVLEFKNKAKKSEERISKADELIEFLWKIHHNYMVHSTGVQDAITHQHEKNPDLQRKWTRRKKFQDEDFWKKLTPLTSQELATLLEKDRKDYPTQFEVRNFSDNHFEFLESTPPLPLSNKNTNVSFKLTETQRFVFYSDGKTALEFSANLVERGRKNRASAMITPADGSEVLFFQDFLMDSLKAQHHVKFKPQKEGFYLLLVTLKGSTGTFDFEQGLPIAFLGYPQRLRGLQKLFLPLPKNTDKVAFRAKKGGDFMLSSGRSPEMEELNETSTMLIKLSGNSFLSINPQENPAELELLNVPNLFFWNEKNWFIQQFE